MEPAGKSTKRAPSFIDIPPPKKMNNKCQGISKDGWFFFKGEDLDGRPTLYIKLARVRLYVGLGAAFARSITCRQTATAVAFRRRGERVLEQHKLWFGVTQEWIRKARGQTDDTCHVKLECQQQSTSTCSFVFFLFYILPPPFRFLHSINSPPSIVVPLELPGTWENVTVCPF